MLVSLPSLSTIAGNNMARQIRKKSGTGIYHVMLRGINRQAIFEDDEDYLQMTSILRVRSERYDEQGLRLSPFCSTKAVFSRVSQTDLTELINTPLEDDGQILDIDTDGCKSISDSDVKAFLQMSHGIANPLMIQSLEKTRRNEVLRYALSFGAGVRQLSRLTGVSYGVVQKLTK